MDFTRTIAELIDTRSFASLWFWVVVVWLWLRTGSHVIGVPYDMVARAARDAHAMAELEAIAHIRARRLSGLSGNAALAATGLVSLVLTGLAILGFAYGIELAMAAFLLAAPLGIVWALSIRAARRIRAEGSDGEALVGRLVVLHRWTQIVAAAAIFLTAIVGTYRNLSVGPLG